LDPGLRPNHTASNTILDLDEMGVVGTYAAELDYITRT